MHKNTRSQTVYHWHTLPVNDVIFTSSGKKINIFNKKKKIHSKFNIYDCR